MTAFAAGDANESSCGNEALVGFSPALPDCRAFELVSPSYGSGATVYGLYNHGPVIAPSGESLLGIAFGALSGSEGLKQVEDEEGEVYEFTRTPTGWDSEAQDPPQSLYPFHAFQAAPASNLSKSVWVVPSPLAPGEEAETTWKRQNNSEYLLREGHRSFREIGPVVAPGHEAVFGEFGGVNGVSDDLDHVVFSVRASSKNLWQGDETVENGGHDSLYEYHGTAGGEPVLVGVKNEGTAPWRPGSRAMNEGASLESECGTAYDGMSVEGARVFFTAMHEPGCMGTQPAANELFARVGGTETIPISMPSRGTCEECDLGGLPEGASFVGVSEDGLLVYFTSKQQMLPGATGTSLYEYDFDGPAGKRVTLIAPGITNVEAVSADGGRVYFASPSVLTRTANGNGEAATAGAENLYVYNASGAAPVFQFVAIAQAAASFDVTTDGQFLVFSTPTDLQNTNDRSAVPQLFEYDAADGSVERVSIGERAASSSGYVCLATGAVEEGYNCDGNTEITEDTPRIADAPIRGKITGGAVVNSVAENGAVAFSSELPLAPGAVQGGPYYDEAGFLQGFTENVYEFYEGNVHLISAGNEAYPTHARSEFETMLLGIDESGKDIFFSSVNRLVAQDTDTQSSWYDAREGGGFSIPSSDECGEECQGSPTMAPSLLPALAYPGAVENVITQTTKPTATSKSSTPKKITRCLSDKTLKRKGSRTLCVKTKAKSKRPKGKKTSRASGGIR
jgi:hypothetical protein